MPSCQNFPSFFVETKHQNPLDDTNLPFQRAFNTSLPAMPYIHSQPSILKNFHLWMTEQHAGKPTWLDVFPFEDLLCANADSKTPLFVDIGGGIGSQCHALKSKYPHVPGRIILQDLGGPLQQAYLVENMEKMAHDFFTPQPIKGAV